jgi:hypothetical protein
MEQRMEGMEALKLSNLKLFSSSINPKQKNKIRARGKKSKCVPPKLQKTKGKEDDRKELVPTSTKQQNEREEQMSKTKQTMYC